MLNQAVLGAAEHVQARGILQGLQMWLCLGSEVGKGKVGSPPSAQPPMLITQVGR